MDQSLCIMYTITNNYVLQVFSKLYITLYHTFTESCQWATNFQNSLIPCQLFPLKRGFSRVREISKEIKVKVMNNLNGF